MDVFKLAKILIMAMPTYCMPRSHSAQTYSMCQ